LLNSRAQIHEHAGDGSLKAMSRRPTRSAPSSAKSCAASTKGTEPRTSAVRGVDAALIDLAGKRIAMVTMVIADDLPEVVMFEGNPFLFFDDPPLTYRQVNPYRADALVIEEA
jgi:hypothetical protein